MAADFPDRLKRQEGFQQFTECTSLNFLNEGQGFSNFEGAGLSGIARVSRAGVLLKSHQDLVLHNIAAVCSTDGLLSSTLARFFGAGVTEETVQMLS